jgi:hypothetical protein
MPKAVPNRAKLVESGRMKTGLFGHHTKPDPVLKKATTRVAAMMGNPASAKFAGMKRAIKTLSGERVKAVCGYVKGKNASGEDTGKIPFVYIVQDDNALLVDGSSPLAETLYWSFCK